MAKTLKIVELHTTFVAVLFKGEDKLFQKPLVLFAINDGPRLFLLHTLHVYMSIEGGGREVCTCQSLFDAIFTALASWGGGGWVRILANHISNSPYSWAPWQTTLSGHDELCSDDLHGDQYMCRAKYPPSQKDVPHKMTKRAGHAKLTV